MKITMRVNVNICKLYEHHRSVKYQHHAKEEPLHFLILGHIPVLGLHPLRRPSEIKIIPNIGIYCNKKRFQDRRDTSDGIDNLMPK